MERHRLLSFLALVCSMLFTARILHGQSPSPANQPTSPSTLPAGSKPSSPPPAEDTSPAVAAEQLYRSGKFAEAIAQYEESIKKGSDAATAYAGLARVYLKLQNVGKAYAAAQKAVELAPSLPAAHVALGDIYFRMGKLADAESEFLVPLRLDVPHARAYFGLSRIHDAAFDFMSARSALDRAYALDPGDPDIRSAWMASRPRPERIEALKRSLSSSDRYYDRTARAHMKQSLAVLEDQEKHPERTCHLVSEVTAATLPLHPANHLDPFYPLAGVDVYINGYRARLVLDTDVGRGIVVSNRVAHKSDVQLIARTDIGGLGAQNPPEGYTGLARSIRIGDLEFRDCYITVAEEVSRKSSFDLLDGYVSAGMFSRFLVDIDVLHSELKLSELPPIRSVPDGKPNQPGQTATFFHDRYVAPEMSDWTRVFQFRGWLLIATRINDSLPRLFKIALGTGGDYVDVARAKEVSTLERESSHRVFDGSGFIKDTFLTGPIKLEFAGRSFKQPGAIAYDFAPYSNALGIEVSGDLAFQVLKNFEFKIDYRDGVVDFSGDKKHDP